MKTGSDETAGMLPWGASKRALRWPTQLSNTSPVVTLGLPSVTYVVLVRKLGLLLKPMDEGADGVGANVFRCLLDDVSSICLVRECREL